MCVIIHWEKENILISDSFDYNDIVRKWTLGWRLRDFFERIKQHTPIFITTSAVEMFDKNVDVNLIYSYRSKERQTRFINKNEEKKKKDIVLTQES